MSSRVISALILMLFATAALAAPSFPTLFTPVPEDLSLWYLGNIFGSELIPGENIPNIKLLSRLFGVFNSVVLAVALIILVYTILIGTLNTAAEGKPLGEKMGSLWIPVRIATGVGLLIPKAGSSYCMAQYVVIWLTMQGIGAADTVWSTMIDYFKSGGMIYTSSTTNNLVNSTPFTYDNMNYTYALLANSTVGSPAVKHEVSLLRSDACMDKFNAQPEQDREHKKFKMYTKTPVTDQPPEFFLIFGDPEKFRYENNKIEGGAECGYVTLKSSLTSTEMQEEGITFADQATVNLVYGMALQSLASNTGALAEAVAQNKPDTQWSEYYTDANRAMQIYINDIVRNQPILQKPVTSTPTSDLDDFKKYGWILAGNYYTTLSCWGGRQGCGSGSAMSGGTFVRPESSKAPTVVTYSAPVWNGIEGHDSQSKTVIDTFFTEFQTNQQAMYDAPDSDWQREHTSSPNGTASPLREDEMAALQEAVGHHNPNATSVTTTAAVKEFIQHLSGNPGGGRLVSQDPILEASIYGKLLTEAAIGLMVSLGAVWMATILASSVYGAMNPVGHGFAGITNIVAPLIIALGGFMYGEGVVLGVFIPLIPYLVFLTGVVGWLLQVVESVAAAPLVAVGLVLPESKEEIWGRAAPAYMLTMNLFLRPSLMIIGFAAAMILTWVVIEILNIGFLTLTRSTFRVENMFGFVTIMAAYVATFTYVVTETYSLINVLPNRVLHWIGDQSMGVKGAEEAIGGAKQGAEAGGRAVAGGAAFTQKADMYRGQASMKERKKALEEEGKGKGGAT